HGGGSLSGQRTVRIILAPPSSPQTNIGASPSRARRSVSRGPSGTGPTGVLTATRPAADASRLTLPCPPRAVRHRANGPDTTSPRKSVLSRSERRQQLHDRSSPLQLVRTDAVLDSPHAVDAAVLHRDHPVGHLGDRCVV